MRKKLGLLEKGIVFQPKHVPGIIAKRRAEYERSRVFDEKVRLLFQKYKVQLYNWRHLAIALAIEHEVGFKPVRTPGRPHGSTKIWTKAEDKKLLAEVARLKSINSSLKDGRICEIIFGKVIFENRTEDAIRRRLRYLRNSENPDLSTADE